MLSRNGVTDMSKQHTFIWYFRYVNTSNQQLLLNFKKHLLIRELKEKTIHEYLKEVSNWMKHLQEKDVKTLEATENDLKEYIDNMDISESRKTRILSVLNTFYSHNKKKRYCKENIVEKYKINN